MPLTAYQQSQLFLHLAMLKHGGISPVRMFTGAERVRDRANRDMV
jgi:hypothetical protein